MPPRIEQGGETDEFLPWLEQRAAQRRRSQQTKRVRAAAFALGAVVLAVLSVVWNPPTASVHGFSKASDYRASRESGCTNSGKGCHGSEKSYSDFNAYHKDAACTACHEYQGVGCIPCHKPSQSECAQCHDGTMEGASDVVRLADPYPRGHYRETTHTAMGTDVNQPVRSSAEGKAQATCGECHSRDLRKAHTGVKPVAGSPYSESLGCGDCHNDTRTSALDQVLEGWKARACEDCHGKKSSAPMHDAKVAPSAEASGPASCGVTGDGCHTGNDLHSLHPDSPKTCSGSAAEGEPGCHDLAAEAHVPTATACGTGAGGGCHRRHLTDGFAHENDRKVHSPGSAAAKDTSFHGIACGECHRMEDDGRSLQAEHALWTSAKKNVPGNACRDCHNDPASQDALTDGWPGRDTEYACDDCHGKNGLGRDHSTDLAGLHLSASEGCASTGPGCHPTGDLSEVGTPSVSANIHSTCLRCHDASPSGGNGSYDPRKKTCGSGRSCHQGIDVATAVHKARSGTVDGADGVHTAGVRQRDARLTDDLTGLVVECGSCHQMAAGAEHSRPSARIAATGDTICERCHNATPVTAATVKGGWEGRESDRACAACHGTAAVPPPHLRIAAVHVGATLDASGSIDAGACVRSGCHATSEVRVLHREVGCTAVGCHSSAGRIDGRGIRSCGGTDPRTSCHTGYAGGDGHEAAATVHQGFELDPYGNVSPGACARSGCHPSSDLRRIHRKVGCAVTGCHVPGTTPSATSCGAPDSDIGCHVGFTADQHYVDHSAEVTGTVNGVTYGPGENVGCFGCHLPDLRSEHATGTMGPTITGGGASGCRVCHFDDADTGSGAYSSLPAVQEAIASRDRRCVACHASGSATPGPKAAASPHRHFSSQFPPSTGEVSTDPRDEWREAFDAPTGGGHNVLPYDSVGGALDKRFPVTSYTIGGVTYTWGLPANSGNRTWLRTSMFPGADTTAGIQAITITCSDCHILPEDMRGPHGSAVRVTIDPAYSQTEYADPSYESTSQFSATGTRRVVCFKCHTIARGSIPGTLAPGGASVHARHVEHTRLAPDHPARWGEKCIDCHVRIPHAWRHQRLLIRTVVTTDGVPADTYPYVQSDHDGLMGVLLRNFSGSVQSAACVNGGCHGTHSSRSHPMPSDVPTATYWP